MPQLTWNDQRHLRNFFVESIRNHPDYPIVIAEGDSWFSYPIHANIIDHLDEIVRRRMSLLRLEDPGDDLIAMAKGGQLLMLADYVGRYDPDALLFSGGGNDIVGPELLTLIAPRKAPFSVEQALSTQALADRFEDLGGSWRMLAELVSSAAPKCNIVTHGYAHAIPSGKKARLWGIPFGPWMKPFLELRGYKDHEEQRVIIRTLIDRFNDMLEDLADTHDNLTVIDLRATITNDDWHDEIHPTRRGFGKAAQSFRETLGMLLPAKFV
jgi:hypothetical protein